MKTFLVTLALLGVIGLAAPAIAQDKAATADFVATVQSTTDRIEGKTPPEAPRRKGQGRRGRR